MKARKTLNKLLLRKVATKLRRLRHEEHYNQGTFGEKTPCGTTACIAGHVAIVAGARLVWTQREYGNPGAMECRLGSDVDTIASFAQTALGLLPSQAMKLFEASGARWPQPYQDRFWNALDSLEDGRTPTERPSRIAADLLDAIADGKVAL